jgi:integrase
MPPLKMDTPSESSLVTFSVIHLVLDSGERLPCLVDSESWIPARVATRWAVRYRRYRVQSSTLTENLRAIRRVYNWAVTIGKFNLDDFLTAGNRLNARQIESLAIYLRAGGRAEIAAIIIPHNSGEWPQDFLVPSTYDHQLSVAEDFLKWALDSANRGGISDLTIEQLYAERTRLSEIFQSLRIGARQAQRKRLLSDEEIEKIRRAIGPKLSSKGEMVFPKGSFSRQTQLRNWLMFETALQLGLRRGELLKLRLDCLPRGNDDGVKVMRFPDDPSDSRSKEPAVKTAERVIPASHSLLMAFRAYLTSPPPLGRVPGKSPYVFVTDNGEPVSLDAANDIIASISRISVVKLSWHSLRHRWAETLADQLAEVPNGADRLMYLGGWTNPHSPKRYISRAIAKQAQAFMKKYQEHLYPSGGQFDESTEPNISD